MMHLKIGKFNYISSHGIHGIVTGGKCYFLPRPIRRAKIIARRLREMLLPEFWAVGLRCCDHFGRVTQSYPVWTWTPWHFRRVEKRWDGAGDGEVWSRISFCDWARWRFFNAEEK